MISRKKSRLVLSIVFSGLLSIMCTSSYAGRSVRSDASDSAFDTLGGFWGEDTEQFAVSGIEGRTEFKLNFGNAAGARFYTFCMSEDGFLRFVTTDTCDPLLYALPPAGNYIAVFATDLDTSSGFGSLARTRGFVDFKEPHKLPQAVPAMRFWWNGILLADDATFTTFSVQIVLLDRSGGTNKGDFDIELNYGNNLDDTVPPPGTESNPNANGFQGLSLGPHLRGPTSGPFVTDGIPVRFCFRGGKLRATCN